MANSGKGIHVMVFPYPAQGHMLPILDFTHQLALHGLTITVIITPKNLPILNPLLFAHPSSIQVQIFPFPDHPTLPHGVENVKDIGNQGNGPIISALSKLQDPIIKWFTSQSNNNPPVALISDFFLGWTQNLAHQIGIPRIGFYSSGSFLTAVLHKLWPNLESFRSISEVNFQDLPRSPCFPWEHLPSVVRNYRESNPDSQVVRNAMIANVSSWASVFNTFDDLEGEFSDYLKKFMGHNRVFSIGPLNLIGVPSEMGRGGALSPRSEGVLKWLNECEDESVLYVCFGSQKLLKKAQMEALANGLEQSGVRFIWVCKPVTAQQIEQGYGSVPDGFEERVSGRGLVMKDWAPQLAILNHRAVGGFLSHCGWNSVMEAVVAGVMIMCWPMEADQFINARLMSEYLGAAVQVCQGNDSVPDSAELGRVISESMKKERIERVKAKELKNKAFEAVDRNGSSTRDLNGLVNELAQLAQVSNDENRLRPNTEMVPTAQYSVGVYAK